MFRFAFKLSNPFSDRFEVIYSAEGKTPHPTKFWEIGFYKTNKILGVNFSFTTREDHAGVSLELDLLGYGAELQLYDCRHWDLDCEVATIRAALKRLQQLEKENNDT